MLVAAFTDRPGHCEVEWVDGWKGGATAVRTSGWGGPEWGIINAGGVAGKMGRSLARPFRLLQLPGETSCGPAEIRERDSPTGNGSGDVCHRTGNPRSAVIQRHGQVCPGLDDQEQIYCGSTELRVASTSRWGFFGYANSGYCGSLPSVGESFGTGAELGDWPGSGLSGRVWRLSVSRMSPSGVTGAHGV